MVINGNGAEGINNENKSKCLQNIIFHTEILTFITEKRHQLYTHIIKWPTLLNVFKCMPYFSVYLLPIE